ncbi:MAG: SipW-dependent-type signal peptide-containing protein [Cryobacterium sp.]|nr:SipW-dependent-type signal peptide-containing protein [Cryobacterium sp.]
MPRNLSVGAPQRQPAHRAPRRRVSLRGVFTSLCAVTVGIFAAVLSAGGTYALWNDDTAIDGPVVTSGVLDVELSGVLESTHWSKLLPGERHVQFVVVTNTGNIPIDLSALSAQTSGDPGSFELRLELVGEADACSSPIPGADALGSTVGLGIMAPGEVSHLCVDVTLSATALPGDDADFSLTLTAGQEP